MSTQGFRLKKRWWPASLVALLPIACFGLSLAITIQIASQTQTGFFQLDEGWTLTRAMLINGVIVLAGLIMLWEPVKQLSFTTFSAEGIQQMQGFRLVRLPWSEILVVFGTPSVSSGPEADDWRAIEIRAESGRRIRVNPMFYREPVALVALLKEHCPPRTIWR